MATEAQRRASKKYAEKAYDRITVNFPKGTKKTIEFLCKDNETVGKFIIKAVERYIEELES